MGGFRNIAMATIVESAKSLLSLIVGMSSLTFLQQADPWAQKAPKFLSGAKGCQSVNFLVCSVCQKLGVYIQQLPITAQQYDISSEEEGRPDEIPEEAAPNGNSNDEEWWPDEVELNAVERKRAVFEVRPMQFPA